MGVMETASAIMGGVFDWNSAYGTIEWLRQMVNGLEDEVEVHGDGLFVKPHICSRKEALRSELDRAFELIEEARQTCLQVLEAI